LNTSKYLDREIRAGLSKAVLKVVREKHSSSLLPQLRLLIPDVVRDSSLALPVIHMRIKTLRDLAGIGKICPDELFKLRQLSGNVHDRFTLSFLSCARHVLPEVGHGEDNMSIVEGVLEAL
jgi:hypothetical protein